MRRPLLNSAPVCPLRALTRVSDGNSHPRPAP